ncbi:MAG: 23S rRNA (adenine(2503)-C(2))-methyltransferase RlmN [Opitutales bacterium]|nr:23S rRNA (adenine(2503)-C(2))-methyltransferase RlmN [Opitutales bacterium]
MKALIWGESKETLSEKLLAMGEKAFRATQILEWIYKRRASSFAEMSNLPVALRERLEETFDFEAAKLLTATAAGDDTEKLLLQMRDGALVECVILRAPQVVGDEPRSRKTVCISTQVGCPQGCKFCASGLAGWKRNLETGEIVAQLMTVCRLGAQKGDRGVRDTGFTDFDNIVVMGMGEPLLNYDNTLAALRIANAQWGLGVGGRRITISTSGVVPGIQKLAEEPLGFRLAISLHGASDTVREQIMPVNRKWPLAELLPAAKAFAEKHGRMITFEFILIAGINDSPEQARLLAKIARELHAHVNLIPYNTVEGLEWERPSGNRQMAFLKILQENAVPATLRREKGHNINAACGQLRLKNIKRES